MYGNANLTIPLSLLNHCLLYLKMVTMGILDGTKADGMLTALQSTINKVFTPALRAYKDLGDLAVIPTGKKDYSRFIDHCETFVHTLYSKSPISRSDLLLHFSLHKLS